MHTCHVPDIMLGSRDGVVNKTKHDSYRVYVTVLENWRSTQWWCIITILTHMKLQLGVSALRIRFLMAYQGAQGTYSEMSRGTSWKGNPKLLQETGEQEYWVRGNHVTTLFGKCMCFISFSIMVTLLPDQYAYWTLFAKHCPSAQLDLLKTSWPILEASPTSLSWKFSSFSSVWTHPHTRWVPNKWLCNLIIVKLSPFGRWKQGMGFIICQLSKLEEHFLIMAAHPVDWEKTCSLELGNNSTIRFH